MSYALAGQTAFSAGMGCAAVFAVAVRSLMLGRMDALRTTMQPSDSAAIAQFRRLHVAGMLINGVQFGAVAWCLMLLTI